MVQHSAVRDDAPKWGIQKMVQAIPCLQSKRVVRHGIAPLLKLRSRLSAQGVHRVPCLVLQKYFVRLCNYLFLMLLLYKLYLLSLVLTLLLLEGSAIQAFEKFSPTKKPIPKIEPAIPRLQRTRAVLPVGSGKAPLL
jgi:hypothetical protein